MKRIVFLLKSQTEYNIHSPYIYRLYTTVLSPYKKNFEGLSRRLAEWSKADDCKVDADTAEIKSADADFFLFKAPHAGKDAEKRFEELQRQYPVSIDLYRVAVFIRNPKLHPQRFLLR